MRHLPLATFLLASLLAASTAHAEPTAQEKAVAESLFRDGRALLNTGKTAEACAKFEDSQKLDPQLGTLVNLALCHETQGRTASAWAEFNEAADQALKGNDEKRRDYARKHAQELDGKLSRIHVTAADALDTLTIKIGQSVVARGALTAAFPVDPGEIVVEASAPGKQPSVQRVNVAPGQATTEVVIPALVALPVVPEQHAPEPAPQRPASSGSTRTIGFVVAGVGLVSAGIGTVLGLQTFSTKSDADQECTAGRCTQRGLDLDDQAKKSAVWSTIAFGAGAVGLGVGVVLIVVGGRSSSGALRATPVVGSTNGLQLSTSF